MNTATIVEICAQLGAVGMVFWLVFHTFTKLIPQQTDSFSASLKEQSETFTKSIEALNADRVRENDRIVLSLNLLEESTKKLADQVGQNSRLLVMHDATMRRNTGGSALSEQDTVALARAAGLDQEMITSAVRAATSRQEAVRSTDALPIPGRPERA